jgi:acetylornithine deacetylase/succinyl-diaminopimelate desuccinylase-like protein
MRHVDAAWLDSARRQLADQITDLAEHRGIGVELDWLTDQPPVPTTIGMRESITRSADALGVPWQAVASGAGHDAAHMAQLGPMGMIFVPSWEGKRHCPQEYTSLDQIATGVRLLAATLVGLDTNPPAPRGVQT